MKNLLKKLAVSIMCFVVALWNFPFSSNFNNVDFAGEAMIASHVNIPLVFEPNLGQTDDSVLFLNKSGNSSTYFTKDEVVMVKSFSECEDSVILDPELVEGIEDLYKDNKDCLNTNSFSDVLRMSLENANTNPNVVGLEEVESKTNYFVGNNKKDWQTNISNYSKIKYTNVYEGIDLVYYGTNQNLQYDFVVAPYKDPSQIKMQFTGANNISIDENGNLVLAQDHSTTIFKKPFTYQKGGTTPTADAFQSRMTKKDADKVVEIPSSFKLNTDNTVSFNLGEYDISKELVIDPLVLEYSTFLGGSGSGSHEYGNAIAVDATGAMYIAGETRSANFPTQNPFQGTKASTGSGSDAFVSKFSPDGQELIWSTYLGGSGSGNNERANAIAVDSTGAVYVAGLTNSEDDFPITDNAFQDEYGGWTGDAFVAKFSPDGQSLVYSTFLGGHGTDEANAIAVDDTGAVYVAGSTNSAGTFPILNAAQPSAGGSIDAFVAKLAPDGESLAYSTYLGGGGLDTAYDIAVDEAGVAYVVGRGTSNFPITVDAFQSTITAAGFVTKISPTGSSFIYSTFLGGNGAGQGDTVRAIAIDELGAMYVAGNTNSTDFPMVNPIQGTYPGLVSGFVSKFAPDGQSLEYSTYLGGTGNLDTPRSIAIDTVGAVYVAGSTGSTDFPVTANALQSYRGGTTDAFISKISPDGQSLDYSTFLGGSASDEVHGIVVDRAGSVYVVGRTGSNNFPLKDAYQENFSGSWNAFITKFLQPVINNITITATVPEDMTFVISTTDCDLGSLLSTATSTCTHTMEASTNAKDGYSISYIETETLTSGANEIAATGNTGANSIVGTNQFGFNLVANTNPVVGDNPVGGEGTVSTNYATANTFSFNTDGAQIASSTTPSLPTTYTASFMANVSSTTPSGDYSTIVTYIMTANY